MATHAPITGAPSCAPVILTYPDTPVARARRELNHCHSERMLGRWIERAVQYRKLCRDDRIAIGRHAVQRGLIIGAEVF